VFYLIMRSDIIPSPWMCVIAENPRIRCVQLPDLAIFAALEAQRGYLSRILISREKNIGSGLP
jgi:hypothetical protein